MIMTKQEARKKMKQMRSSLQPQQRRLMDEALRKRILSDPVWSQIDWFYPFVSYGTEIDTLALLQDVLKMGHISVAVPRVAGRDMDFYQIHSMEDLVPGYQGILEPAKECPLVHAGKGLMLLPGLAFDPAGHRVGYGGGYYDRYLAIHDNPELLTWAIAYPFQIVDNLLTDPYDITVKRVITP